MAVPKNRGALLLDFRDAFLCSPALQNGSPLEGAEPLGSTPAPSRQPCEVTDGAPPTPVRTHSWLVMGMGAWRLLLWVCCG